jgi:hypothetical protein
VPPEPDELAYSNATHTLFEVYSEEVFGAMKFENPFWLVDDLHEVLRKKSNMTPDALGRANWLLAMDRFRQWMDRSQSQSDLLLVDGRAGDFMDGKISPLSVFTVLFKTTMDMHSDSMVIYHFCGLHSHVSDSICGPVGMIRSFIAQLLFQLSPRHDWIMQLPLDSEDFLESIARHDISVLLELLRGIIYSFPSSLVLYCIIDGIEEFETDLGGWEEQLHLIIVFLQATIEPRIKGPRLRVLITSGHKSIKIFRDIAANACISLEAGNSFPWTGQELGIVI